jgi:hypothetical protein
MTTGSQHRLQVYTTPEGAAARDGGDRSPTSGVGARCDAGAMISDFAVGFSRQPLPKGNRFAIVTNAGGPGIMATDAAIRHGLELAKLRPETLESLKAKLPPTANLF